MITPRPDDKERPLSLALIMFIAGWTTVGGVSCSRVRVLNMYSATFGKLSDGAGGYPTWNAN